jgi:hypothetical protein
MDAVLLSHDQHDDNLDPAGRALLPAAGAVITTITGAERLGGDARGLAPWATTRLEHQARPLGGVRFPVTGPARYTMTAADAMELCEAIEPRTVIPIHYEGWRHFREGRSEIERELTSGPADVRKRFRWLAIGASAEAEV